MSDPTIFARKQSKSCEMCGNYKMNATFYQWKSILTDLKKIICHRCAMREHFGTNYKQNKRYMKWSEDAK